MKKIIIYTLATTLALGSGSVAFAQTEEAGTPPPTTITSPAPQSFIQKMMGLIQNRKEVRTDTRAAIKDLRTQTQGEIKDIREGTASSSDKRMEIKGLRENLATTTKDMREKMASTTKAIKEQVQETRAKVVDNRFNVMTERYQATIQREGTIMAKLSSRISIIKSGGGNTDTADKLVVDAKAQLDLAKVSYASLAALASSTTSMMQLQSGTTTPLAPAGTLVAMKKITMELESHLKTVQQDLEKAVGSLMGSSQLHATTTRETN